MTTPSILLDVHAHLIPLGAAQADAITGHEGVAWSPSGHLVVDGAELANAQVYDATALVAWMDRHDVGAAWVSVPPTLYRSQLDMVQAERWCRLLNAAMDALVARHAPRLQAMHLLPMQHPEAAARIATDGVHAGQRRYAMAAGDPMGLRVLSSPDYESLWQVLDTAQAFLFLHPGRSCDRRLTPLSLSNLLGGPYETALAGAHLAMGGVAERHPGIQFCLAHGGGALPAVAGRLQRGQDTGRDGSWLGGEKVRTGLRRFCVDCITHDGDALTLATRVFGEDRVVFGSDWPFAMGLPDPAAQLESVSPVLRTRIQQDNAQALLRRHGDVEGSP